MKLPPWNGNADFITVGQPYPRIEGAQKVTGSARYTYDMRLPGQLYARILRSPHPHARIRSIDVSEAECLPAVYALLSSANTPDIAWYQDDKSKLFDTTLRSAETMRQAAEHALTDATPLAYNAYKVTLAQNLLYRALTTLQNK